MVKRREPQATTNKRTPTAEEVEAFAAAAEGGGASKKDTKPVLDPNANRDFKSIRVPFNQFEYSKLEEVATKTGRTKLNVIRWAIMKLAEDVQ